MAPLKKIHGCHWLCRKTGRFYGVFHGCFFRKHKDELTKNNKICFFQVYFLFLLVHLCVFLRPRKECFPPGKFLSLTFCISTRLASNWGTQKAWLTRFKKILISIARRKKKAASPGSPKNHRDAFLEMFMFFFTQTHQRSWCLGSSIHSSNWLPMARNLNV